LPASASLPAQTPAPAPRHPAAHLELVGRAGTLLLLGVFLGLLLLDGYGWRTGVGFSGQSLVAGGAMGLTVLPVGALCWVAGWRLRLLREEPPALGSGTGRCLDLAAVLGGIVLALILGLPG
jgi:hypothetical protein